MALSGASVGVLSSGATPAELGLSLTRNRKIKREVVGMYIQYRGFGVATNSRIYKFHVIDPTREQREFTVKIQSDTNHWASLKLQDGPGICFER